MSWQTVTKSKPCPSCQKTDWCAWSPDGQTLRCMRDGQTPVGMRFKTTDRDGGRLFVIENERFSNEQQKNIRPQSRPHGKKCQINWSVFIDSLCHKCTSERLNALSEATGVTASAWEKLNPGWADTDDLRKMRAGGAGWSENYPDGAWAFAEYHGDGRLAGVSLRAPDGRKGFPAGKTGAHRGIVLPTDLHDRPDPVLIVEGASDVAACCALGLAAVGRPSNRAGAADLGIMLDGREVLVIGERDGKPGGSWPGRDGAKTVATQLAGIWGEPVSWTLPPADAKDVRTWLIKNTKAGLDISNDQAAQAAGRKLLSCFTDLAKIVKPIKRSQADALVDLGLSSFHLGRTDRGDTYAIPMNGPRVAMMFRGSKDALRLCLSQRFRQLTGKTPSASALADALTMLEGQAMDAEPERVSLRIAEMAVVKESDPNSLGMVLDLANNAGQAVVIDSHGWQVVDQWSTLFYRTALTGALPVPVDLDNASALLGLRDMLNVTDEVWPMVVGWLVACFFPSIPHPVMMLGGEQGTGKSSAARWMVQLIDPSPALLRSEPRDVEQWMVNAAGSWCVVIDNVSRIYGWWSDALCKAVTGEGWIKRKLYTDSDVSVQSFRRCIMLTSVDAGALRGDLGDRLLLIDLERIPDEQRKTESELYEQYQRIWPSLLAGLLSTVSRTLAELPNVKLETMPRMADFSCVLAALDQACPELTGGRALDLFIGQRQRIADDVVDADPVATAVIKLLENQNEWTGTATELLDVLTPRNEDGKQRPAKNWPKSARGMSGHFRRIIPALRSMGIDSQQERETGRNRTRLWTIRKIAQSTVHTVRSSDDANNQAEKIVSTRTLVSNTMSESGHEPRSTFNGEQTDSGHTDDVDGSDGLFPEDSKQVRYRI